MSDSGGLESLTPVILRFPIEKTIKAFVNLKLGRKKLSSFLRIVAAIVGLILGYIFPQIGETMGILVTLVSLVPFNPPVVAGVTLICSMILTSAVLIYITKKIFQYYNLKKYGVSNSENRITDKDKKLILLKFDHLDDENKDLLIKKIERQITFLVNEINKFKTLKQLEQQKNVKAVLNRLKLGEITAFQDFFRDDPVMQSSKVYGRQQQLAKLMIDDLDFSIEPAITVAATAAADTKADIKAESKADAKMSIKAKFDKTILRTYNNKKVSKKSKESSEDLTEQAEQTEQEEKSATPAVT